MIFGRPANLYLGVITAALNAAQLLGLLNLTPDAIAALNILAAAVIALLAGVDRVVIADGLKAQRRQR